MTTKELIEIASKLPPNTPVVVPSEDHSYRGVGALFASTALRGARSHHYTEDFGEEITPEEDYGNRIKVLIIS